MTRENPLIKKFISGLQQFESDCADAVIEEQSAKITTLEAQIKELSGLRVCPACGEKYSDEPSSHPSYGALEVTIKALQLENAELKVGLDNTLKCAEHVENQRKQLQQALDIAKAVISSVNDDLEFFHHAARRYIEVGRDKQDITKVGTPIRIASGKIAEALQKINTLTEGK